VANRDASNLAPRSLPARPGADRRVGLSALPHI